MSLHSVCLIVLPPEDLGPLKGELGRRKLYRWHDEKFAPYVATMPGVRSLVDFWEAPPSVFPERSHCQVNVLIDQAGGDWLHALDRAREVAVALVADNYTLSSVTVYDNIYNPVMA